MMDDAADTLALTQAWVALAELCLFMAPANDVDFTRLRALKGVPGDVDEGFLDKLKQSGGTLASALKSLSTAATDSPETLYGLGALAIPFMGASQRLLIAGCTTVGLSANPQDAYVVRNSGVQPAWKRTIRKRSYRGHEYRLRGFGGAGRIVEYSLDILPWCHDGGFDLPRHVGAGVYENTEVTTEVGLGVYLPPPFNQIQIVVSFDVPGEARVTSKHLLELDAGTLDATDPPTAFRDAIQQVGRFVSHLRGLGGSGADSDGESQVDQEGAMGTSKLIDELKIQLQAASAVVLQGPPGTGKTHHALQFIKSLAGTEKLLDDCRWTTTGDPLAEDLGAPAWKDLPVLWEIVQLHPSYAYEDLVRGLTTQGAANGGVEFVVEDKLLVQLAQAAAKRGGKPTVLILDEINRCNLSAVLGELILVLEKGYRDLSVRLQYVDPAKPKEATLTLPKNLWFIGTMNTADRSIAMVDFAIRRRFRFIDVEPDDEVIETVNGRVGPEAAAAAVAAFKAFQKLVKPEDRAQLSIGHSYFLLERTDVSLGQEPPWQEQLADRIIYEVLPLLREYAQEGFLTKIPIDSTWSPDWMPAEAREKLSKALKALGLA